MQRSPARDPTYDDTLAYAIGQLRAKALNTSHQLARQSFDFDVYDTGLRWARQLGHEDDAKGKELAALLLEVAWELVRRGILRPGTRTLPDSNISNLGGFCITRPGREWLKSAADEHFILLLSKPLIRTFAEMRHLFGDAFALRAQESVECRDSGCFLASCAMSGAAAESVLLALGISKSSNQEGTLKVYNGPHGRKKLTEMLVANANKHVAEHFRSYMNIVSYWRDDAAHGASTSISYGQAEEALRQLLGLAQFATKRWTDLTNQPLPPA